MTNPAQRIRDTTTRRPLLAVKVGDHVRDAWLSRLSTLLPTVDVQAWDTAAADRVDYAAVWRPEAGKLAAMSQLKGIVSIAAGADHIVDDPDCPTHIPIVRCTGAPLQARMAEYVVLHALGHHRKSRQLSAAAANQQWRPLSSAPASQAQVGIMGMGVLGQSCVLPLQAIGFKVAGWTRRQRHEPTGGVRYYAGESALGEFLATTNILVCLLPSTSLTRNLLDAKLFSQLPQDACVINVARGDLLVEEDLIAAIDSGHIREATLDVFRTEPLPVSHPFWHHPGIRVTPHVASLIDPQTGAVLVADHVRRFINNEPAQNLVDPLRGY